MRRRRSSGAALQPQGEGGCNSDPVAPFHVPMAPCAECGEPTSIPARDARGTPLHRECWLARLRRMWHAAPPGAQRDALAELARRVEP